MSVTDLRDRQNAEWHAWAERNPDQAREHNAERRDRLAGETSGKKVRLCDFVSDEGVPCLRKHKARGMCSSHYDQWREGGPLRELNRMRVCDFEGCDKRHHARGYCFTHYCQWRKGGAVGPVAWREPPTATPPSGARDGSPWAEWEFDLAMSDTPLREVAIRLGRTYSSVVRARQRRRRMLGLGIERTKTGNDPYDGTNRAGVLYKKDAER